MTSDVRVRFAPSPTGLLHIGGLRTALYNYLVARKNGGQFILRIEDTDRSRFVPEAQGDILSSLDWAGLDYDEGPEKGGPSAPYYQSERQDLYRKHADELIENGFAYFAFDTPEEWEAKRQQLESEGVHSPKYDASIRMQMRNSLSMDAEEVKSLLEQGTPHVVRLKVPPDETISFRDIVRGDVEISTSQIDDQVLIKSDGMPTYHLANVVDDHEMGISHVIRGEEWLPSVPKHILLYRFFGWDVPSMAHLPLILSPTGGKLSKRNADAQGIPVSVRDYREAGYEPQALVNFLAFLGWNPGTEKEVFSIKEMIDSFDLERVGSAGVQFSMEKLNWYNEQYVRSLSGSQLAERLVPELEALNVEIEESYVERVAELMRDRVSKVDDILTEGDFFFREPDTYPADFIKKRWKADSGSLLHEFADVIQQMDSFEASKLHDTLQTFVNEKEIGFGKIMPGLRLCISGKTGGPDLFEMMELLGQERVINRIHTGVAAVEAFIQNGQ